MVVVREAAAIDNAIEESPKRQGFCEISLTHCFFQRWKFLVEDVHSALTSLNAEI